MYKRQIIPFTFCYNPALILDGALVEIIIALLTGIIGVVFIDISLVGYIRKPVPLPLRGLLLIGGVLLVVPSYLWSAIGFVIGSAALASEYFFKKAAA